MTEHAGLLSDIIERPDDDTPRLIFADWLEDRGQPGDTARAAFIRLQIESAATTDEQHRRELHRREKAMLTQHGRAWARPLRPYLSRLTWRRGFVERAAVQTVAFLEAPDEVLSLAPLRQLHFREPRDHMASLMHCPHLARLDGISLAGGRLTRDELRPIRSSPHLETLKALDLGSNALGDGSLAALIGLITHLSRLEALGAANISLGVHGMILLAARNETSHRMRHLDVEANHLTDDALHWLAHGGWGRDCLESLAIGRNRFSADAVNYLLERMPRLKSVSLGPQPRAVREQLTKDYPHVAFRFAGRPEPIV